MAYSLGYPDKKDKIAVVYANEKLEFTDRDLYSGINYIYNITAYKGDIEVGKGSIQIYTKPEDFRITGCKQAGRTYTTIDVQWNMNSHSGGYFATISGAGLSKSIEITDTAVTNCTFTNLVPDKVYMIVIACLGDINRDFKTGCEGRTAAGKVKNLRVNKVGENYVGILFDKQNNADSYEVDILINGVWKSYDWRRINCLAGLESKTTYDLRVRSIGSAANASTDKLEAAHEPVVKTQYNDGNTSVWFKAPTGTTLRCTYDGSTPTSKTAVYNGTKFKFSTEKTFKVRVEREGYKPAVYTYTNSVIGNSIETLEKIHSRVSYLTDYTKHPAYIALTAREKKLADDIISGERSKLIDQLYIKAIEECEILSDEEYYEKITLPLKRHYGFLTDEERNNAFTATRLIETSKNAAKSIDELFEPYLKNIGLKNSELKSAKALAKSIVEKALKKTTPYEQIKSLHDSLCEITQYDYDLYEVIIGEMARKEYNKKHPGTNHILVNGLGVCADYTDVFNLLCNAAGYEAVYAGGSADGEPHAWSAVKLEGTWYYVDTTWDDNEDHCGYAYFLKGNDTLIRGSRRAGNNYIDSIVSRTDYKK